MSEGHSACCLLAGSHHAGGPSSIPLPRGHRLEAVVACAGPSPHWLSATPSPLGRPADCAVVGSGPVLWSFG